MVALVEREQGLVKDVAPEQERVGSGRVLVWATVAIVEQRGLSLDVHVEVGGQSESGLLAARPRSFPVAVVKAETISAAPVVPKYQ